jgi:nucleoside-diphosphate-sugar epimerase
VSDTRSAEESPSFVDTPSTVVIAGCGDLGTEIGLHFVRRGDRVIGIRRRSEVLPESFEGQSVDLATGSPELPRETDLVVIALAADAPTEDAYRSAYLDGLRTVLDALERVDASPRRLLMVSSTAVYNVTDGSWVDETSPTQPTAATGAVLVEAERLLHARYPDAIVLRLAGIYGPGRQRLVEQVRSGTASASRDGSFTNRIHRDDAAAAAVHLLTMDATPDNVYVGVDDLPVQLGEVVGFLAGELGVAVPNGDEAAAGTRGRGGSKRCSNARLRATGFELRYPDYTSGYRAILAGEGVRHP